MVETCRLSRVVLLSLSLSLSLCAARTTIRRARSSRRVVRQRPFCSARDPLPRKRIPLVSPATPGVRVRPHDECDDVIVQREESNVIVINSLRSVQCDEFVLLQLNGGGRRRPPDGTRRPGGLLHIHRRFRREISRVRNERRGDDTFVNKLKHVYWPICV